MLANLPGTGTIGVRTEPGVIDGRLVETDRLAAFMSRPMPRDPRDMVPFGPLNPLRPQQLDPSRPDTDRAEPRIREYEVGSNLPGVRDHHHVSWEVLRTAADSVDIMRRCIELRKDHLAALKWAFTVTPEAVTAAYEANPAAGKSDLEAQLRAKYTDAINRATEFWRNPWETNDVDFAQWVRAVMEQYLVYDGVCVYPECTIGGDMLALNLIDVRTIKLLTDYRGQRPRPPFPAYQQILYGFPRGEFEATIDEDDAGRTVVPGGYLADQMYYYRRNFRVQSLYGYSVVEQALNASRLYMRRFSWMLSEYDDGVLPELIMKLTETTSLTPRERREYEDALNDELGGNTRQRHRAKVAFPGMDPVLLPSVDERYKPDYDLFLIKLIASHFGVSVTDLGFSEAKGLGSSGMHEAQADAQEIASIGPDKVMISDLVNKLSRKTLNMPTEIAFTFVDDEGDDTLAGEQANQILLNSGQATINDGRRRLGQPIFEIPEADMPFILGGTNGVTFLEGSFAAQQAGRTAAQSALTAGPAGDPAEPGQPAEGDESGTAQPSAQPVEKYLGPDPDIASAVIEQLSADYPPESMAWIHGAHWSGPKSVPVGQLDMADRDSWRASRQPDVVSKFVKRQKQGRLRPAVLVQEPNDAQLKIIDGHHRALAAERNGMPLLAYVGKVGKTDGPWDEMHSSQVPNNGEPDVEPVSAPPATGIIPKALDGASSPGARAHERAVFRRYISHGRDPGGFTWNHHGTHEVAELLKATATGGGDADPKAPAPGLPVPPPQGADQRWPMWLYDTALAILTARKLRKALTAGLDTSALASAFVAARPSDPVAWLRVHGVNVVKLITQVIRDAMAQAYAGGTRSAQAVLASPNPRVEVIGPDWGGWRPGRLPAARKILSDDGSEVRLAKLLDDADVVIGRVAANRLDEIAAVLADGLERGETPATIARALRGVVDDPAWAMTVAWTETNRAQSAAALDQYRAAGKSSKEWMTAHDQRVCPVCAANEAEGPIALDADFESGDPHPPGHPRCRCALIPGMSVLKVGPKGYEHGWIYVGVAGSVATDAKKFPDAEAGDAWGRANFPATSALPAAQRVALERYVSADYEHINGELRAGRTDARTEAIDAVMSQHRLREAVTVHRGVGLAAFGGKPPATGDVYADPAYLSTSVGSQTSASFRSKQVQMSIDLPKGTPSYYVGAAGVPGEHELLVGRGEHLVITKVVEVKHPWGVDYQVEAKVVHRA
jgi:SPP1 gp7 family putative phage head morphogenesis protein